MKYKRILAGAFALALVLPLLTVSAHPGRTDGNGGHTDSDTGDYHYHHGYEAHAHFDIDGNGTIDCPYDFVDATDHSSGTRSSGSYTPGNGSEDGYPEGYEDGYKKGEDDGYDDGYRKAAAEYKEALKKSTAEHDKNIQKLELRHASELDDLRSMSFKISATLAGALVICALLLRSSLRKRSSAEMEYRRTLNQLKADHLEKSNSLEASHEAEIARLKKQHESSKSFFVSNQARLREQQKAAYEARIAEMTKQLESSMDSAVADQTCQFQQEKEALAAEIRHLKLRLINFRRLEVLEQIAQGKDDSIKLPEGVALRPTYAPIRGKTTRRYPYGSYTVFLTTSRKTYHCKHDCVPKARPAHFFDLPDGAAPCRRCVPPDMHPQPLPDWYIQLREKLDSIVSTDFESSPAADHAKHTDDPQIRFSLK